ncbi:hypothetical protein PS726_06494 [Pseudomonas fluorescens]|nr:hypothetical protein PS726_06492 [Pseudomonas fluorescens]VVO44932.1 hypothetical protein PS726_06494 [Pseudomonas fluorescens]
MSRTPTAEIPPVAQARVSKILVLAASITSGERSLTSSEAAKLAKTSEKSACVRLVSIVSIAVIKEALQILC